MEEGGRFFLASLSTFPIPLDLVPPNENGRIVTTARVRSSRTSVEKGNHGPATTGRRFGTQ